MEQFSVRSLIVFSIVCFTGPSFADELRITLVGVPKSEGTIHIGVLGSEAAYKEDEAPITTIAEKAQAGAMSFVVSLPSGTYGVQAMHDLNDNGELDTGFMGMPKEPWGFSNNAKGRFGPPKWKDLVFTLDGDHALTIDLNL